jgi:Fe-Mn family superoxide dismutase
LGGQLKFKILKQMNKREFIKTSVLAGTGLLIASESSALSFANKSAVNSFTNDLPFQQPVLGYSYNALEPYIDAQTMEIHYSRHHAAYTKNFNTAVIDNKLEGKSIEAIFANVSNLPVTIRNNGGGYYNHNLYWEFMAPVAGGEPSGEIAKKINSDFGSFAKFKEEFSKAAAGQFGSGWAWLILKDGKLQIITTPNQDNPLMDIAPVKGQPILNIDVWEHAYYLKYQNKRADYISAYWNVVNWKKVEERYLKIAG